MKVNWRLLFFGVVLMCMEIIQESCARKIKVRKMNSTRLQKLVRKTEKSRSWENISHDPKFLYNMPHLHYLCSAVMRPAVPGHSEGDSVYLRRWIRKQLIKKTPKRNMNKVQTVMSILCRKIYSLQQGQSLRERTHIKYTPRSRSRPKQENQRTLTSYEPNENSGKHDGELKKLGQVSDSGSVTKEKEGKPSTHLTQSLSLNPSLSRILESKNITNQKQHTKQIDEPETENPEQGIKSHTENKPESEQKIYKDEGLESRNKSNHEITQDHTLLSVPTVLMSTELSTTKPRVESEIGSESGMRLGENAKDYVSESNQEPRTLAGSEGIPEKADIVPNEEDLDENLSPEINETFPSKPREK